MLLNRKHSLVSCFDLELLETHPVKIKSSKVKQKNFITDSLEFSLKNPANFLMSGTLKNSLKTQLLFRLIEAYNKLTTI